MGARQALASKHEASYEPLCGDNGSDTSGNAPEATLRALAELNANTALEICAPLEAEEC